MTINERKNILQAALDHQFDDDENADLILDSADPLLRAAVAVVNHAGGYSDVLIAADDEFFGLLNAALSTAAECAQCWEQYQSFVCLRENHSKRALIQAEADLATERDELRRRNAELEAALALIGENAWSDIPLLKELMEAQQQRDELAAALEDLLKVETIHKPYCPSAPQILPLDRCTCGRWKTIERAGAALAPYRSAAQPTAALKPLCSECGDSGEYNVEHRDHNGEYLGTERVRCNCGGKPTGAEGKDK